VGSEPPPPQAAKIVEPKMALADIKKFLRFILVYLKLPKHGCHILRN
jgi:hypothetical protein